MLAEGKDNPFLSLLIITILIFLFTVLYYRYQVHKNTNKATQNRRGPIQPTINLPFMGVPQPPTACLPILTCLYLNAIVITPDIIGRLAVGHHQSVHVARRARQIERVQTIRLLPKVSCEVSRQG